MDNLREFVRHYLGNLNPWRLFVTGDPNFEQIAHLYGAPLLLAATGLLAIAGLVLILRVYRREAWWRFVVYCLFASVVPASLTKEYVHMLRLAPLPVFVIGVTAVAAVQRHKHSPPLSGFGARQEDPQAGCGNAMPLASLRYRH